MVEQYGNVSAVNLTVFQFNASYNNIFYLIFIGLVLCAIAPFIMQKISHEISRLGVFHQKEPIISRIKKLYWTYLSIMSLMWIFIIISVFSFSSLDNIIIYTLISSSVFSLTTRIMVTTGLIECSELETEMKMDWTVIRERVLSAIYSATVLIVIIAFIGVFILAMLYLSGQGSSYFENDYLIKGRIIPNILIIGFLWVVYPLILATLGEGLRWIISKMYPPPDGLIVNNKS